MENTKNNLKQAMNDGIKAGEEKFDSFMEAASDAKEIVKNKSKELTEVATNYIQENPWKSIGISMLGTLVISKLFSLNK